MVVPIGSIPRFPTLVKSKLDLTRTVRYGKTSRLETAPTSNVGELNSLGDSTSSFAANHKCLWFNVFYYYMAEKVELFVGYLHINNLYKNKEIMMFRECYALEKIHGSSAWITCNNGEVTYYAGGQQTEVVFKELFDEELIIEKCKGIMEVTIFGEVYGGKIARMSNTYGKEIKFVGFDVQIDGMWLAVPQAESFIEEVGMEFVHYEKIPTEIEEIDRMKNMHSVQAVRNGMGEGKQREGVVLRPLIEVRKNNDERIIVKHKGDKFKETKTPRVVSPEELKVLEDAKEIAEEWVTLMRLQHVLQKIEDTSLKNMKEILTAMCEDVKREGEGEIVWSDAVHKAICSKTAPMFKDYFQNAPPIVRLLERELER